MNRNRFFVAVFAIFCVLVICLAFVGCKKDEVTPQTESKVYAVGDPVTMKEHVEAFTYSDKVKNAEGKVAIAEGFKNKVAVENPTAVDILERAKLETTIQYSEYKINYDDANGVWMVTFTSIDKESQSIVMDKFGVTTLIINDSEK